MSLLICSSTGCTSHVQVKIKHQFTTKDVEVFVNDVALVADPSMLYGEWKGKLTRDFNYRIHQSDFIGLGKVIEAEDKDELISKPGIHHSGPRALFQVEQVWQGTPPKNPVELKFRSDSTTFDLEPWIRGEKEFVLFARRGLNDAEVPTFRWTLSPANENLILRTKWLIQKRPDFKPEGNSQFKVHTQ